ncbi:hypothetical protein AB1Y20_007418 [Prymnesium parvum]|uniref:(S)-ureidoglycine aminohydrolase cupin domain-containing protein n=1 Tax=Prymnesium parvum TaxID=97485 RepID=A0AB34IVD6_PRYPA
MFALLCAAPAWRAGAPCYHHTPTQSTPLSLAAMSAAGRQSAEEAAKRAWLAKNQPAWSPPRTPRTPTPPPSPPAARTPLPPAAAVVKRATSPDDATKRAWLTKNRLVLTLPPRAAPPPLPPPPPPPRRSAQPPAKQAWLAQNKLAGAAAQRAPPPPPVAPLSAEEEAKRAWLAKNKPAWSPPPPSASAPSVERAAAAPAPAAAPARVPIVHATAAYFALDRLAAKGTRRSQGSLVDVGEPHDFSRPLATDDEGEPLEWSGASVGSWACTAGGWDSPKLRPTTEVFLVLDGKGSVTDADGTPHPFGEGDVVVLPKQWSGRWDITRRIHKLWLVHDHPDVEGAAHGVVRAVVAPLSRFAPKQPRSHRASSHVAHTIYHVGPTHVGFMSTTPGSFAVPERSVAECFFVVDGVFFLTNVDGSSRRCSAGDTVVLPKGWTGHWDIMKPGRIVWIEWAGD